MFLVFSPSFQIYKPDSFVEVHNDGMVYWFVQAIYSGSCPVWVKWFPFDTQVCYMTFTSWTYNGHEMDLEPDQSLDGTQRRFVKHNYYLHYHESSINFNCVEAWTKWWGAP